MADIAAPNPTLAPPAEAPQDPIVPQHIDRRRDSMWTSHQFILALVISLCLFGFLGMLAWHPAPPDNRDLVNIIMTSITTGWVGIVSYFFGSSSGTKAKDNALATLAAKTPGEKPNA